jgi:A/G-specific adenine glycosylase
VDYAPDGEYGRDWLRSLVADLADDGLVAIEESAEEPVVRLRR